MGFKGERLMKYCVINNVKLEDLDKYTIEGESWKRLMGSSPYLVSTNNRIWYKDTIYYDISLEDFFKYVVHLGEDDE